MADVAEPTPQEGLVWRHPVSGVEYIARDGKWVVPDEPLMTPARRAAAALREVLYSQVGGVGVEEQDGVVLVHLTAGMAETLTERLGGADSQGRVPAYRCYTCSRAGRPGAGRGSLAAHGVAAHGPGVAVMGMDVRATPAALERWNRV